MRHFAATAAVILLGASVRIRPAAQPAYASAHARAANEVGHIRPMDRYVR
jgi:hypothetical protein